MGIIHPINLSVKIQTEYDRYKHISEKESLYQVGKLLSIEGELSHEHIFGNVHSMYDNLYDTKSADLSHECLHTIFDTLRPIDWYFHIFNELAETHSLSKKSHNPKHKDEEGKSKLNDHYKVFQIIENFYLTCYLVIHHSFINSKTYKRIYTGTKTKVAQDKQMAYSRTSVPNVSIMLDHSISQNQSRLFNQKMSFGIKRESRMGHAEKMRNLTTLKATKHGTFMVNLLGVD